MSGIVFDRPIIGGTPETRGKFGGTVKVNGVGAVKRVCLLDRRDFSLVISCHSRLDGTWTINGLPLNDAANYLVVVVDDNGEFNAEVADHLTMFADGA